MTDGWRTDTPPDDGYYLATWLLDCAVRVSELRYTSGRWSTGRFYMPDGSGDVVDTVVAWQPMPEPLR